MTRNEISLSDYALEYESPRDTIEHAAWCDLVICKYADPIEDAREGLTVDEACEVAAEDPSLIYFHY